jgi:hypothetical protein
MAAVAHFLTANVVRLEMFRGDMRLGTATGFLLKQNDAWYLVSNWHVFSGRSPTSGQSRRKDGAVPNVCGFSTFALAADGTVTRTPYSFFLGNEADQGSNWFEHPNMGQRVDVGVLPVGNVEMGTAKDILDPSGHDETMWIDLGGELFLPGYPLGLSAPEGMAIWKRASLATSTEIGEGRNLSVLVDTATREGMSGSPCLALANSQYYSLDRENGQMQLKQRPFSYRLIGVYSGRVNAHDNFGAQLGVVWRENLIFETIEGAKPSTTSLV